ncbi:5-hydroxytryptamine receptor 3A-like [Myxocyprinus asiaticus]|uniref:5-hydroxytryptamine receptor 3A-like n=1 Tax=Myxocyprinus asiaticus TaxID=70543 RepID=UPI002223ACFF|nr:5-hydroxytryptamine receptor 3A-like [Myxocyprinus asiaticus]
MYLHWLMFSLASFGWVSAAGNCSYKSLVEHLGLGNDDIQMTSLRPVINWWTPTQVFVDLFVTSITEVNEKAQSFSTQVTIVHGWINEFTLWDPEDFCGIYYCSIRKDMIWTPDIGIIESIETEYATLEGPYVQLHNRGFVVTSDTLALTTACKMDLHLFPFDIQSCTLTLQSAMHSVEELKISPYSDASFLTLNSQKAFQTQGEWELLSINMSKANTSAIQITQDQLTYKITMKRRPLLYIINFIVPVFYFLVLDVASFFMDGGGGEKLSFKVTLLLSISVLLLILNDMLPSTAKDIPLIGTYCSVIFTLIGISILETIFVNYLMSKGEEARSVAPVQTTAAVNDVVKGTNCTPESVTDRNEEQSCSLIILKQILMEFQATTHQNQDKKTSHSWTRVARIIDITFFSLYLITVVVFITVLCKAWFPE